MKSYRIIIEGPVRQKFARNVSRRIFAFGLRRQGCGTAAIPNHYRILGFSEDPGLVAPGSWSLEFQGSRSGLSLAATIPRQHRSPNWYEVIRGRSYRSRSNRFRFLGRSGSRWLCDFVASYHKSAGTGSTRRERESPDIRIYFTIMRIPRRVISTPAHLLPDNVGSRLCAAKCILMKIEK